ncbi:TPA: divalent-cation tolerance protein CutA [Candidatus Poribacteria bacterium]|nr:divalent-cation tolerance protein CutA [Candidatus Poribacteria bacterium]
MQYIQVITTTERKEEAERMAEELVERRLAGCVQIVGPITSIYRWKGEVVKAQEWLLFIKTGDSLYERVEKTVKELHPYETPEIIATEITAGSREYLEWLEREVEG